MNEYMEECVSCGTQTDINIDTHLNYRRHYISGVGQLCASCGEKYDNPNEEGIRIPHQTKGKKIGNKEDEDLKSINFGGSVWCPNCELSENSNPQYETTICNSKLIGTILIPMCSVRYATNFGMYPGAPQHGVT